MLQSKCFLVGGESLLVQCAEILLERGHEVVGVATANPDIESWAEGRSLPVHRPGARLGDVQHPEFDWLLSIANLTLIPEAMLAQAGKGAINFHDGPLPRYAGLNAPNWALIAGEPRHGVTWHRIEGGIDEGRILARRDFDVEPLTTALELNTRCYAQAIDSFPEVVDLIERDAVEGEAQDLSLRTYFGKDDRPEALALLDWTLPAETLLALIRALDFGAYPNPLQIAKTIADGRVCLVAEAEIVDAIGDAGPGTIVEVSAEAVVVATGTDALRITRLLDQDGAPLRPETFSAGDVPGQR